MDLLPDLQDLEIVAPEEIENVMIGETVVNELNTDARSEDTVDLHEDVFGSNDKKPSQKAHLDSVRAKSIEARWGPEEVRLRKKAEKILAKKAKAEARKVARELKAELNREKARNRYWDKKAKNAKGEMPPPATAPSIEEARRTPPEQFTYNQFSKFMDERDARNTIRRNDREEKKRARAVVPPAPVVPEVIYKEKIVYKETYTQPTYPSIFNHISL